jgi:hypothetical protein
MILIKITLIYLHIIVLYLLNNKAQKEEENQDQEKQNKENQDPEKQNKENQENKEKHIKGAFNLFIKTI